MTSVEAGGTVRRPCHNMRRPSVEAGGTVRRPCHNMTNMTSVEAGGTVRRPCHNMTHRPKQVPISWRAGDVSRRSWAVLRRLTSPARQVVWLLMSSPAWRSTTRSISRCVCCPGWRSFRRAYRRPTCRESWRRCLLIAIDRVPAGHRPRRSNHRYRRRSPWCLGW